MGAVIHFFRVFPETEKLMHMKRTSGMSRHTVFLLCVLAVLLQWQPWSAVSAHDLVPPKGYSLGFTATIAKGTTKYMCSRGMTWIKTGSSATLSASDGSNLGTYGSVINPLTKDTTYYWTILNGPGTYLESGQTKSGLQATAVRTVKVLTSSILEYLAIVRVHSGAGDADQVAFVSLSGTKGGLPPHRSLCTSSGATSGVPITATFRFYTQDRQPPAVPASLTPSANFLQVVFLEGKAVYAFSRGRWRYRGVFAAISDVAGGTALGKFGTAGKADKNGSTLFFQFKDPNGFWMWGQDCAKPVQMTADGFPWQLMKITTSGGTQSPFGSYKYALLGATMGGLPPKIAPKASGMTWSSPFTAQCYMYT